MEATQDSRWLAQIGPWHAAQMLQNWISALVDGALYLIAWWAPVAYFVGASFITYVVAGDNERARNWMIGLFMAVFILVVALIFGWPNTLDDAS